MNLTGLRDANAVGWLHLRALRPSASLLSLESCVKFVGLLCVLLKHSSPFTLHPTRAHTRTWRSPVAGALTINVGDMLQVYSNDRYVAPLHRVLANRDKHRYSAPFFFNPVSLLLPLALLPWLSQHACHRHPPTTRSPRSMQVPGMPALRRWLVRALASDHFSPHTQLVVYVWVLWCTVMVDASCTPMVVCAPLPMNGHLCAIAQPYATDCSPLSTLGKPVYNIGDFLCCLFGYNTLDSLCHPHVYNTRHMSTTLATRFGTLAYIHGH